MPFLNRVRLPIMFAKPQYPMERNTFRLSNGVTKVLSIVVRNTFEGKTDQLPEDWHRKLVIAMAHDTVNIENERLLSNVVLEGDYQIDWQDFLQYPIANATFAVQVTPFNATNNNCQTCEEMQQLNLVDDSTAQVWNEGETHTFPDVLTDNDSICCNPFTIQLVSFNALYFSAVTISAAGLLTATVKNPCPDINNVLIATYRVTCADGSYDEANVYGNIQGSSSFCDPVQFLIHTQIASSAALLSWFYDLPAPASFVWYLYLTSDLGTPIRTGTLPTGSTSTLLTALDAGVSYTFVIFVDCSNGLGTSLSLPVAHEFTITPFTADLCGKFTVAYLPAGGAYEVVNISYMDCYGNIKNEAFSYAQTVERCMLIMPGATSPVYFVASSADVAITYSSLC